MPIFGEQASHFDQLVEKATSETNTGENWGLILDICDRVSREGTKGAKAFMLSVKKRLNNRDPHVVLLALSVRLLADERVLDSGVSNCSSLVLNEMCTREFIAELRSKATMSNRGVAERTRILLKKWADEHKDAAYSLLSSLVKELITDGYSFESSDPPKSRKPIETNDPNFVSSAEEEAAIAKAIAASLNETPVLNNNSSGLHSLKNGASASASSSLYPAHNSSKSTKTRPVKALYDFEAAEDNELTFKAGELITVTDDSDINWWKGTNSRGEGLFPSNFVTADLSAQVVTEASSSSGTASDNKKSVQFDDNVQVKELEKPIVIDEDTINRCMELLDDADPTGETPDSENLLNLEANVARQVPLIDEELSDIDSRYNLLADIDIRLRDALALYDTSMQQASLKFAQVPLSPPVQNMMPGQQPMPQGSMPSQMPVTSQGIAPAHVQMPMPQIQQQQQQPMYQPQQQPIQQHQQPQQHHQQPQQHHQQPQQHHQQQYYPQQIPPQQQQQQQHQLQQHQQSLVRQ